jgi:hypothetical protein
MDIEEPDETTQSLTESLQVLVGEKLSAVTFLLDQWQIDFDGSGFNVMSQITVTGADWACRSGEPGFRDRLCEQIGKIVADAEFEDDIGVSIIFEDGSGLQLSTEPDDYRGAEALLFHRTDERWWVV